VLEFISVYQIRMNKALQFMKLRPEDIAKHLQSASLQSLKPAEVPYSLSKVNDSTETLTTAESGTASKKLITKTIIPSTSTGSNFFFEFNKNSENGKEAKNRIKRKRKLIDV
jgi:hypothetical protein